MQQLEVGRRDLHAELRQQVAALGQRDIQVTIANFAQLAPHPQPLLPQRRVEAAGQHRFLQGAGYRLVRRTGLNGWYVPEEQAATLDALGRWQIARKYYLALPFRMLRDAKRRWRDRIRGIGNAKT